ncbi:hypothetical protein [Enterococcus sp. DIV1420a]|uniref:hypothetical protein n=1 Tax=Enterococcus sp. DIV1420a TaxID=2774672 RepID=UPI003F2657CF
MQGKTFSNQTGIWLDEDFFQANNYQIGDYFLIEKQPYKILGTVRQPEFIYHSENKNQPLSNHKKNGYAYLPEQEFNRLQIYSTHQLLLKTNEAENTFWLENELSDIWVDDFIQFNNANNGTSLSIFFDRVSQVKRLAFLFSAETD